MPKKLLRSVTSNDESNIAQVYAPSNDFRSG